MSGFDVWRYCFDLLDRFLFTLAVIFAVAFNQLIVYLPPTTHWIIKVIPPIYLGLLVLKHVVGSRGLVLALALFFTAAGEVFSFLHDGGMERALLYYGVAAFFFLWTFRFDFLYSSRQMPAALLLIIFIPTFASYLFIKGYEVPLWMVIPLGLLLVMLIHLIFSVGLNNLVLVGALTFLLAYLLLLTRTYLPAAQPIIYLREIFAASYFLIGIGYLFNQKLLEIKGF